MTSPTRGGSLRPLVLVLIAVVIFGGLGMVRFYTDVLWFREVGFSSVLYTSLSTQFVVGVAAGVSVGVLVWVNLVIAGRLAPAYRIGRLAGASEVVERYRALLTPYLRWVRVGVAAAIGLVVGLGTASMWQRYLLWANRVPFGNNDPQFGRDISYFVFELPFYNDLLGVAWFALTGALVVSAAAHYFHGAIRPENRLAGITPGALAHLSVLMGLLALVKAAQYYLGTYELVFSPRGNVTGASYTDVTAQLPALRLLAIISVLSAVLFLVNIRIRRPALPLAALGIWILTAVLAGAVWPWWVQRFSVDPQELQRERPYIKRNIEATQAAFNLHEVKVREFLAAADLDSDALEQNASLLANVRLWDPSVLQQAYSQLQSIRTYYGFHDVDIDRYEIDGEKRQVMLSARELSLEDLPPGSQTWSNRHLQYTHGYGLVASLSNAATSAGQPEFLVRNVPGTVDPGAAELDPDEQPRIYYGEAFSDDQFSIVNTRQDELDYPGARSNYQGDGGIPVGSFLRRLTFAVRELDPNIALSDLITDESRILLYRNVRDRVLRAAPFLSLDHDPYPAVVEGRLLWILDGYTTTTNYPYSQRFSLRDIVASELPGGLRGEANYVRNSVKVVVDAYDGSIDFHVSDEGDPLIRAWRNAFPDLFATEPPSDELRAHFRYPEDLFNIQSEVYLAYHMESPDDFYAREDAWAIPENPAAQPGNPDRPAQLPATYLLVSLPGEGEQEFVLARPFTPRARNVMISFLLARADPDRYGDLELLEFPASSPPLGPTQIDNLINQDVEISRTLTLLRQGGSDVAFGSLVIVPIEESLLYVLPLFVTAEGGTTALEGIPELKRVVVVYGEQVEFAATFDEALAAIFDLEEPERPPDELEDPGEAPEGPAPAGRLARLVDEASDIYERAQEALAAGDFERYGRLITRLGRLLEEARSLSAR